MPAMLQKRSLRRLVVALWLLVGLIVVVHAGLQYISPGAGGPSLGLQSLAARRVGLASRVTADARSLTALHAKKAPGDKKAPGEPKQGKWTVNELTIACWLTSLVVAGTFDFRPESTEEMPVENEKQTVASQWMATIRDGFTTIREGLSEGFSREQEDKNLGLLRTNQSLLPLFHNAQLLNNDAQKTLQATAPCLAMAAVSYYSIGKKQQYQTQA